MKYEKVGKPTHNNIQITTEKYLNKVKCVKCRLLEWNAWLDYMPMVKKMSLAY